ncbi:hypothetical protein ANCCAN_15262 [Ancylostoma caninum]|uniref:Protein kinase domain-containing protein n=1 Tax=Ancylostoma caninum TaxID=29170 RepID=A0A368G808_ANCCA|nr:hypothetical protein ANCCAN_15262 [Ancylostoma caninum]
MLAPHVFIVRLYASWQTRSKLFSVLQYPIGGIGDMFGLWREHGTLPNRAIQIYGAELGTALDFLHSNGVVYRDLKLENIVLDSQGHVRVVDFGLSKVLKNGEQTSTICGTLQVGLEAYYRGKRTFRKHGMDLINRNPLEIENERLLWLDLLFY